MLKKVSAVLIKIYQYILSPVLPPSCRFYPTCSEYTLEAINEFGFGKGLLYAIKRIFKCHSFHEGGYDPIILKEEKK